MIGGASPVLHDGNIPEGGVYPFLPIFLEWVFLFMSYFIHLILRYEDTYLEKFIIY